MIVGKGSMKITIDADVEFTMSGPNGDQIEFTNVNPQAGSNADIEFSEPFVASKDALGRLNSVVTNVVLKVVLKEHNEMMAKNGIKTESFIHKAIPSGPVH